MRNAECGMRNGRVRNRRGSAAAFHVRRSAVGRNCAFPGTWVGLQLRQLFSQFRNFGRQFDGAAWGFAEPEGDRSRRAMGVLDDDFTAAHVLHAPRHVAEQEDVAPLAFDGEILVQRADESAVLLGYDTVVGLFGNGAARGLCGNASPAARAEAAIDAVAMQLGALPAALGDAFAENFEDGVKVLAAQVAIRPGAAA